MRIIDTHCHLYSDSFRGDGPGMIQRALDAGIERFYLPNVDLESIPDMLALENAYPDACFPMMGLHPCSVKEDFREVLGTMQEWLEKRRFAGIGEIGLDFHWDLSFRSQQEEAFQVQMEWGISYDLPIVIHSRKSMEACLQMAGENCDPKLRGIFHCFSGTVQEAEQAIALGFYLGIGGVATYKNGGLEPVIQALGLEHLVLETDAPYLSPVPFRGKRNEPAYLVYVVETLARMSGRSPEEVASITTANAEKIFRKHGK
jgi:TatD DNase family protein